MFLSEFFMPVTVVAFLVTFGKYISVNWFGFFMPTIVGLELLLFATTGGVKLGELADQFPKATASQPNKELLAARQRKAVQAEQSTQQEDETKKSTTNTKQDKANAKKAAQVEKAAAKKSK